MVILNKIIKDKRSILCFKLLVGLSIIFFVFQRIDVKDFARRFLVIQWPYFVLCLFLFFLGEILHSLRWRVLLKCKGIEVSNVKLLYFNFVGLFFNLSFPGAIGGDAVRMHMMSGYSQNTSEAVASVLMDRGIGFFTLLCVAPIMVFFSAKVMKASVLFFPIILVSVIIMAIILMLFSLKGLMQRWRSVARYYDVFYAYRSHKKIILLAMVISLGMIFLNIVITYLISHGLKLYISLAYFIIFVPIIFLITMIPLSIQGLGLREGAFVFFFAKAGLSASEALSISFILYFLALIFSLIGGIVYILISRQAFDRITL